MLLLTGKREGEGEGGREGERKRERVTYCLYLSYRDMKSANVLVKNENGDCVIGDLGFAMILDPSLDSKQLASTGQVTVYTIHTFAQELYFREFCQHLFIVGSII